jgi:hypothetical protein
MSAPLSSSDHAALRWLAEQPEASASVWTVPDRHVAALFRLARGSSWSRAVGLSPVGAPTMSFILRPPGREAIQPQPAL